MNKRFLYFYLFLIFSLFNSCGPKPSEELVCLQIIDRTDMTKTISQQDRLKTFQKTDFAKPQPYKQVVRVYQPHNRAVKKSKITSYYKNGNLWQYLEAIDSNACGQYLEYYPNGQLAMQAKVIGGPASLALEDKKQWLFDQQSLAFDEEGNILGSFFYEQGLLEKEGAYYYSSGKKKKIVPYLHNEIHGQLITFFENGNFKEKANYQHNQKNGSAFGYFKNGKLAFKEHYQNNLLLEGVYFNPKQELVSFIQDQTGFKTLFHENGEKTQIEYQEGQAYGVVKRFNSQGSLIHLYHQKNGKKEGEEIEYFPNGVAKISLQWSDDKIQGEVKTWYENGQLASSSELNHNKKNGLSTSFYEDGSLMLVEEYDNDLLKKGKYYKKGEKKETSSIQEGEGLATLFDKHGNFLKKVIYSKGRPDFHE